MILLVWYAVYVHGLGAPSAGGPGPGGGGGAVPTVDCTRVEKSAMYVYV